jgi:nitroreductase
MSDTSSQEMLSFLEQGFPTARAAADTLIRHRRSVFMGGISAEPIAREDIAWLLEMAHWAPNHGKTEPWFFKVYTGAALEALGQLQAEVYQAITPAEGFKQETYDRLLSRPSLCGCVIGICMKRGENPNIPVIEEVSAVACAVQNLWIAASAIGLAGYWSTGQMVFHPLMRERMGLGPEDQFLGFFNLGYLKGSWPTGQRKAGWEDKVEWVGA